MNNLNCYPSLENSVKEKEFKVMENKNDQSINKEVLKRRTWTKKNLRPYFGEVVLKRTDFL